MEKESKYEKILTSEHHMLIKERKTNKYIIANSLDFFLFSIIVFDKHFYKFSNHHHH